MKNKDLVYVGLQFLLFAVFFLGDSYFQVHFKGISKGILLTAFGALIVLIAIIQLNTSLSPFPTPKEGSELITSGIYSFVRHPIYLGLLVFFLGYSIYFGSYLRVATTILLAILFHYKSSYEESQLVIRYPEYKEYKKRTSRIIPFV